MKKVLALPKGLVISCPVCSTDISRVNKDIYHGETLHASYFEPIGEMVQEGATFQCWKCDAWYFLLGRFFTKNLGWFPPKPKL